MTLQDYTMSKALYLPVAFVLLMSSACAQQPHRGTGALARPGAHTASADLALPRHVLAQEDDQDEKDEGGPSLEERARSLFGTQALRGTLPANELNQEIMFKFLISEIASQRGNSQLAAQGYLDMA